ncbi:helix-turn-helix domain-containing protein [Aegicerativicinus sediminis]|uniref:helix-turn-helix domain-containing protein n=1 Tax=Aegicerativicinus sediminis TaxID=2893202 RepID=UPI001E2D62B6|nr:AraC family transcriptional regulator [Aegicerativicinus sediminis]
MKEPIYFEDIHANEVIEKLANEFGASLIDSQGAEGFLLPEKLGKGIINSHEFTHGIETTVFDFSTTKTMELSFNYPLVCPLRVIYNLGDSINISLEDPTTDKIKIDPSQYLLLSTSTKFHHILEIKSKSDISLIIIDIYRKDFEEKIEQYLKNMDSELVDIFRDLNGINQFYHKSTFPKKIAVLIEELLDSEHEDFMKSVFVEGKTQEILATTIQTYMDTKNGKGFHINDAYLKKLEQVEEIIQRDLENVPSIAELAKLVGINQNKLQQGFKHMFKVSVNNYIRNQKMSKARELLESTDLNITEISERIGINSKSYFSKLFRQYYGLSPKNYQCRFKEENASKSA